MSSVAVGRPTEWDSIGDHERRLRALEASPGAGAGGAATELRVYALAGTRAVANGTFRWWPGAAGALTFVQVGVSTAPTGASLTVRIKLNGVSIGTVSIAAGTFTNTFVPGTLPFAAGDYYTVDVTAVGSSVAGADLEVQFWGAYS